jgi:ferredoxin
MIVAQRKSIPELIEILKGNKKVLVLGCGTCVTVCLAGGEREVSIISSALRIASRLKNLSLEVDELTIERQCDNIFIEKAADAINKCDVVLSLGCGAGVQAIAERYNKPVYAGLDTEFIGILEERATWTEKCAACGKCVLHEYGGICPITRCAKHMLNGPCGGSREDRCEVRPDRQCAWQLIYQRLKDIGELDKLKLVKAPKNWNLSLHGGSRVIIREDHRI